MTTRDFARLGFALLLGAAIAFPAGMMVAGSGSDGPRRTAVRDSDPVGRQMFSPSVRNDPWFLERQRDGVAALEAYCTRTGESCPEARAARQRLTELEAAD